MLLKDVLFARDRNILRDTVMHIFDRMMREANYADIRNGSYEVRMLAVIEVTRLLFKIDSDIEGSVIVWQVMHKLPENFLNLEKMTEQEIVSMNNKTALEGVSMVDTFVHELIGRIEIALNGLAVPLTVKEGLTRKIAWPLEGNA